MSDQLEYYFEILRACCNGLWERRIMEVYPTVRECAIRFARSHSSVIGTVEDQLRMLNGDFDLLLAEIIGYPMVPSTPEYDEFDQEEDT